MEPRGQELTSCQSKLASVAAGLYRRGSLRSVQCGEEPRAGLHVGDTITAGASTPKDAKLNQADSPTASGSARVYGY